MVVALLVLFWLCWLFVRANVAIGVVVVVGGVVSEPVVSVIGTGGRGGGVVDLGGVCAAEAV